MKSKEFNLQVRELNRQYRELFHELPCIEDYACSREEFLEAMQEAIQSQRKINLILKKIEQAESSF